MFTLPFPKLCLSTLGLFVIALHTAVAAELGAISEFPDQVFASTPETDLRVDIFVPKGGKRPPLLLYIHGGGWKSGTRKAPFAKSLAEQGFAVASIDYRFSSQAKFPSQIFDCKGAVRWLRANASRFCYDASRVAVMGESAGGQLAVLLGTSGGEEELEGDVGGNKDQSSKVQAVVDFFGATDFLLRSRTQPAMTETPGAVAYDYLGGPVSEKKELARLASGVSFVTKDDPPLLAVHGDADQQVLIDQSERIVDAYKKKGLEAEFIVVPGGVHSGLRYHEGEIKKSVVEFLTKFLHR
ncbi:MAG: alpha/beta hydrolase [Luteolibacter sp.]